MPFSPWPRGVLCPAAYFCPLLRRGPTPLCRPPLTTPPLTPFRSLRSARRTCLRQLAPGAATLHKEYFNKGGLNRGVCTAHLAAILRRRGRLQRSTGRLGTILRHTGLG